MNAVVRGPGAAFRRQAASRLVAAVAVGATLNLAFAPFAWWPLGVLTPAALFALIRGLPPRRAAWVGAAFGAGLFAFGTYWLYTCLHVFGLVPVWLTLFLQVALVAFMATFSAALCYLANRFWLKPGMTRDWLVLPALWVLLEWLRGWILTGFPWLSLGYAFIDTPLAGWAPLLGVYGVTWAAAYAGVALSVVFAPGLVWSRRLMAVAAIALLALTPLSASRHAWTHAAGERLPIAAVQGAVSQDQKWQIKNRDETMARYANLTSQAWGARLIVWPESALPVLADSIPEYLASLRESGRAHDADFAIGLVNYEPATARYFNGLLVMTAAGDGWYYKRHLVPFGEYFPVPPFVRSWMRLMSLPYDDISAGSTHQPLLRAAGQALGVTICYEDAFGSEQLDILRHATLLINVTNNAWFGDSTAPHQHLQISRMRALEAGRYLVRATNDGITAAIGPRGEVLAQLPQFTEAVLRVDVQPLMGLTPYARWGNYPVVLGASALLGCAVWRRRRG
ncbi:MAG: apolipoprotein N-acyltransferase, partial [Gammaproteobacteria bacterium]|nr:apolipoprotein N-acyltransferase [Gammaproteobacteria bacterium]